MLGWLEETEVCYYFYIQENDVLTYYIIIIFCLVSQGDIAAAERYYCLAMQASPVDALMKLKLYATARDTSVFVKYVAPTYSCDLLM